MLGMFGTFSPKVVKQGKANWSSILKVSLDILADIFNPEYVILWDGYPLKSISISMRNPRLVAAKGGRFEKVRWLHMRHRVKTGSQPTPGEPANGSNLAQRPRGRENGTSPAGPMSKKQTNDE